MIITENKKKYNTHNIELTLGKIIAMQNALQKLTESTQLTPVQTDVLNTLNIYIKAH